MVELPKWLTRDRECLYCSRFMTPVKHELATDQDAVRIMYECHNLHCEHQRRRNKPAELGYRFVGTGHVTAYKEWVGDVDVELLTEDEIAEIQQDLENELALWGNKNPDDEEN